MQLRSSFVFLLVSLCFIGLSCAQAPTCAASFEQLKTNHSETFLMMFDATGKGINDLGKWDQCRDLGKDFTQYCLLRYAVPVPGFPDPYLGLCVPAQCSAEDIDLLLREGLNDLGLYVHYMKNVSRTVQLVYEELEKLVDYENKTGQGQLTCYSYNRPSPSHDSGAVIMIIICFIIITIAAIGTILDGHLSNWWPEVVILPVAESEPLLPGHSIQEKVVITRTIEQPTSRLMQFFLAFSVVRNWNALIGPSPPSLSFLNGIRAMSIMWVILGHTLVYMNYAGVLNFAHVVTIEVTKSAIQVLPGAEFSVDTFFWLSGFLVTYLTLVELKSRRHAGSGLFWGMYYFHRLWRLTPTYMFALFFYRNVSPYLGYGPLWNEYTGKISQTCGTNWWTNVLYVDNFIPATWSSQCFLWGWYLAVDMQLYIIAPIILIMYSRKRILGWGMVILLIILSLVLNFAYAQHYKLVWNSTDPSEYMNKVYGKPYTRASPWLLGIACAFLHHEKRQISHMVVMIGYFISALFMILAVYGPTTEYSSSTNGLSMPKNEWSQADSVMYYTFSKFAWTLGLSFILYTFCLGYGGFVRRFLGAHFWNPFARLTYATYLFHPIIMFAVYYSTQQFYTYSAYTVAIYYVAFLVLGFSVAVILFVTLERPFVNLEKLFLKKKH